MDDGDARAIHRYLLSLGVAGEPTRASLAPGQEPDTPWFDFMPRMPAAGAAAPAVRGAGSAAPAGDRTGGA